MRSVVGGIAGIWLLMIGAFWFWSGLSILVGTISGSCEKIDLRSFGPLLGRHGGTCLALDNKSSWDVSGGIAALVVLMISLVILAGALWILNWAAQQWSLR